MNHKVAETNYDVIFNVNMVITNDIKLNANLGWNLIVYQRYGNSSVTNGGIKIPGLFSITNTAEPLTEANISDFDINKKVDGFFAQASLGYKNMLFFIYL